jgi:transcriptional/translational regulatory protein YebC/TACO1
MPCALAALPHARAQGKSDMARAKLLGRVGKQIVAACAPATRSLRSCCAAVCAAPLTRAPPARSVKAGGPSENSNAVLAQVLQLARLNNIPKARDTPQVHTTACARQRSRASAHACAHQDLIDRNVKRATDKSQADYTEASLVAFAFCLAPPYRSLSQVTYEAYGLGGVGMVIEILTDNLNRAAMTVRTVVTKAGAKMADPGSVLFNFERRGFVVLTGGDEDTVFAAATDAGADDVTPRPGGEPGWEIVTQVNAYGAVLAALRDAGLPLAGDLSGLRLVPLVHVDVVRPCARSAHACKQACDHALTRCAFVCV